MSKGPLPNSNIPQIPQPIADLGSLVHVAQSLKQGVDALAGNRGNTLIRAVTFNDLIDLGLITVFNAAGLAVNYASSVTSAPHTLKGNNTASAGTMTDLTVAQVSAMLGISVAATKLLTVNNTITFVGTDGKTYTFPTTDKTIMAADFSNATYGQVPGTATNDSASVGNIGEIVASIGSTALTTGTPASQVSISLTAGDWDVFGAVSFAGGATTTLSWAAGGISTTNNTLPATIDQTISVYSGGTPFSANSISSPVPTQRLSLAGTTTVYLVAEAVFGVSTCTATGKISARRRR